MKYFLNILLLSFSLSACAATNDHSHDHDNNESNSDKTDLHGFAFGQAGAADQVDKVIVVVMTDNKYDLESLDINAGDTIHFKIKNDGQQIHELTIATQDMHTEHQTEMLKHISSGHMSMTDKGHGGGHDHDNSLLLNPGEQGELIWTFAASDNLEFACNVPGHYQSGMLGKIIVN